MNDGGGAARALAALVAVVVALAVGACGAAQEDPFEDLEMSFDWRSSPATASPAPGRVPDETMGQTLEDALAEHADELTFSRVRSAGGSSTFSVRLAPRKDLSTDDVLSLVDDVQTAFARNLPREAVGENPSVRAVLTVIVEIAGVTDVPTALVITSSGQPSDHEAEARFIDAVRSVDTRGAERVLLISPDVLALTYPDEDSLHEGMVAVAAAAPADVSGVGFRAETRRWNVNITFQPGDPVSEALPGLVGRILDAHDPWISYLTNELELHSEGHALTVSNLPGGEEGPDADAAVDILRAADDCGQTPVILHAGDATHPTGYVAYTCTGGHLEVNEDAVLSGAFTDPVNNTRLAAELLEEVRR
ncbi:MULTISPECIES: hypothetical protein [Actinomyces]|uniref:Uncharacterized protein n=1 Tax=Actinomyces respiraculi TaxID=2744574 RepID=A0A7T0PX87_9ACTO|nr:MULTISPECIES: hypothetical protein [Actinomyces]QPL05380.1 hypothetical protein ID810_11895 [Actinomyces respiraculi]